MKMGKTILEWMQEHEPLNDYDLEDICQLYCSDGPMPCKEGCSWKDLFTKRRFVEVVENNPVEEQNPKSQLPPKGSDLSGCVSDSTKEE